MEESPDTVSVFLTELLGGKEYSKAEAIRLSIRRPSRLKTLFTNIVGVLKESEQLRALEALISLVRSSCGNVEACSTAGLQREILGFLSERGLFADPNLPLTVLKKLLRVFLYLAYHSVHIDDIQAMLAVFRSMRMVHEEPDDLAVSFYLSTLELIARDSFGPASFFDLNGDVSGLLLPVLPAFPNNGYTFCAWMKFELLPEDVAPLFTFCGKTGVGIMCSFLRSSLILTSFDKRKNDGHVEVPDLVTPGRWHFLCITHTHRQFRGSKVDVYLNAELRQSVRLAYPNTALMVPVVNAFLAMRESTNANALRILLGPTALFGQALPASIINNIRSVDEYDALVFQFNSYISSSTTSSTGGVNTTSGTTGSANVAGNSTDGLLWAYDARHCDRLKGVCYDSSGNNYHAAAASAGVRLRHAGTFKQAVAQLGGPLICIPLLVTSTTAAVSTVNATARESTDLSSEAVVAIRNSLAGASGALTTQFDEDSDFLKQMSDLIARPMGVRSIPKVVLLIAEIMRHSLVNKFIFRRSQGVRLMALLMRSLPPHYLTNDLFIAIERLRSAVMSDQILADEIYKFLLFNFRIWVNAPVDLQEIMFDKLEVITRKDSKKLSPASTRHFLRCLSWIYWRSSTSTTLRRARDFSPTEIDRLRNRVLAMIRIVLCDSSSSKLTGSVIPVPSKGKEIKSQLSYESTRTLLFCMIGKPSNPMIPGMNIDGTPVQEIVIGTNAGTESATVSSPSRTKSLPESDLDGSGSVVENVPEADLPDLVQLLIELSVESTAPTGMLDLFGRLGGLRIWLPLLEFSNDVIRVMTLRLLRTYLYLKCECTQDPEMVSHPDKIQLSVGDAYLIMHSLKPEERPVSMGVYSEILLMILGVQVTTNDMKVLDGVTAAYDALIDENVLTTATIWHDNMMPAFLGLVRASSVTIRMVAIRHLKIIFASSTVASSINRHVLIFGSISSMGGTATESSTTEQVPIIEAILSLRGNPHGDSENLLALPSSLFGIELHGCPNVPMSRLRDMVLNTQEPDEVRVNALYSIIVQDDVDFVRGLLALHGDGDRKKQGVSASCFNDMSSRMKLALVELMSVCQPSGCVDFITLMSYDVISSMICLEVKTNEMAWFLLQDPFTTLSRFITSTQELEVVVVSLLKITLDKMNEMLSAEMNLRFNEGTPSRESILWRNAESLASLAAAVVLHYDPDTLGQIDPSQLINSSGLEDEADVLVFWKCERTIWHEAELVDSILGIWQHFASHFHSNSDASFARRSSTAHRRHSAALRPMENGLPSPPSLSSAARTNTGPMLGFGFNLPAMNVAPSAPAVTSPPTLLPGKNNITARPHPGGPMRQILQLLLRCLYLVLISDDYETAATSEGSETDELSSVKLRLPANSVFFQRINKLEYFINAMGLGHDIAQFESCFAPSRSNSNGTTSSSGLVTASKSVKAIPGDETTLLLWLIPELSSLIDRVRRKSWSESAVKLASILASLVSEPLRSSDQLAQVLAREEFITNNQEVRRRDRFYHEQMAHARDIRALRRVGMFTEEANEKIRAKHELARISQFTRSSASLGTLSSEGQDHVWLERVKAKDIDDWMKLRVLAKWGVRHVWGVKEEAMGNSVGEDGTIIGLWGDNEFWRVDIYTSSNWIRCRLLPDTDDTITYRYGTTLSSSSTRHEMLSDDLTMPSVDAIVVDDATTLVDSGELIEHVFEEEEDDDESHTMSSGGDGDDSEVLETDEMGYVGLSQRISDVGYLDDYATVALLHDRRSANDRVARTKLHNRIHSSELSSDVVGFTSRVDAAGRSSEFVSTAPLAPPPLEGSTNGPLEPSYVRDRRAVSVDVATTVKSAKGRMNTISTRFSTSIKRLASARSTTVLASSGSDTSQSRRSLSNVSEDGVFVHESQNSTSPETIGDDRMAVTTSTNEVSKPTSPKDTSSSTISTPRVTKKLPSKHEHWKTLGAPFRTKAYLVLPSGVLVHGDLRIGIATIVFEGERVVTMLGIAEAFKSNDDGHAAARQQSAQRLHEAYVSQVKRRVWGVRVIRVIHRRRFLMESQNGLEIYFVDGSSCFFGLEHIGEADLVYATLKERKPPCLAKWGKRLLTADRMLSKSKWTDMWIRREISNFEYLMALNVSAGRSYNDLAQYPVFPWVLKDYESSELRLDDEDTYRDLRRPIGAQTPEAIQRARATFENSDPNAPIPAFHYPHAYSHMQSVLYFLLRLAPITSAVLGSDEQQLHPKAVHEPTFDSIAEAFHMSTHDARHMFELPPEFFYLPELFQSARNKTLARHFFTPGQDYSTTAGLARNVVLPPWASSPYEFVRLHRLALESDYVSRHLHHWIDLIFGYKQSGTPSIDAMNAYHIACYPERLDLSTSSDGVRAKLVQRGTIPMQLFRNAHPARMTQDESLEARYPASHSMALLSSRRQVRRYDLSSKHTAPVTSVRFSNAVNHAVALTALTGSTPGLGSGTGMGAHSTSSTDHGIVVYTTDSDGVVLAKRYLNAVPDTVRSCPFSMVDVDQWWKLPAGCLVSEGVVFYEQMISCGYWDGSWRIHWAADGELLQRIAFHKKPILCMARSEDDFTGDLAVAFGSQDCTVSVWALSKLSASRSRRLFLKKELPVGGLPWVLLVGHTRPVVAVALNVDLDVVVSASKENIVLLHSLRGSMALHALALTPGPFETSVIAHLVLSAQGDTLVHSITTHQPCQSRRYSRANSLFSDDKAQLTVGGLVGTTTGSMVAGALSSSGYVTTSESSDDRFCQQDGMDQQSELYVVSINGHVVSHDKLVTRDESTGEHEKNTRPQVLLERGVLFTRSCEYLITACTTGVDAAVEVRNAGMPGSIVRRIECRRVNATLTSLSMGHDERCIVCGYSDGAVVAYALHFGIADGCKSLVGLDKQARERERAAFAQATKRDLLRQKRREDFIPTFFRGHSIPMEQNTLWVSRQGKSKVPDALYLTTMQKQFALLKQTCNSGDDTYERLLRRLWDALYTRSSCLSSNEKAMTRMVFERVGDTWSRLGFQRPDPTTDFRAGGMLSLDCLVYFASHYTIQAVRMVSSQVPGSHAHTYPWGPAGINLTCMVARLFWKFDGELVREQSMNWPLFETEEAFRLVFSEVFVLFDYLWNEMNANYGNFTMVIQATSDRIRSVLNETPGDLNGVLLALRAQSVSVVPTRRKSVEEVASQPLARNCTRHEGLTASDGTRFQPSTPPSKSSRSTWSFTTRLGLGNTHASSCGMDPVETKTLVATTTETSTKSSLKSSTGPTTALLVPTGPDIFAGNDFCELGNPSEDPFACLL